MIPPRRLLKIVRATVTDIDTSSGVVTARATDHIEVRFQATREQLEDNLVRIDGQVDVEIGFVEPE